MGSLAAPGSNSFRDHQYLDVPSLGGASLESSMCHNNSTTSEDHLLPCVDSYWNSLHNDGRQSFPRNTNIPNGIKDERRIFHTEQGASLACETGPERWGITSSFSEILPADYSGIMGNEWSERNELDHHFSLMDRSGSAGAENESLEQIFSWSSLYASTLSDKEPIVTAEDIAVKSFCFADEKSGISMDINPSSSIISPFTSHHHLRVHEKMEDEGMEKPSKRACNDAEGFVDGYSVEDRNLKTDLRGQFLACSPSPVFGNKSLSCIKDESSSTSLQPSGIAGHHPSNCSSESAQSNIIGCRSHADDDSDICIIEEMSHPAPLNQTGMPIPAPMNQSGKPIPSHKRSLFSESHHHSGVGNSSFRTNSEQQIFRVALQVRLDELEARHISSII